MPDTSGFQADHKGRAYIEKDPNAELSYAVDWSDWMPISTSLDISSFTVSTIAGDADPLTVGGSSILNDQAIVNLTGGTAGNTYTVTNNITSDNLDVDSRRFLVVVKERYL